MLTVLTDFHLSIGSQMHEGPTPPDNLSSVSSTNGEYRMTNAYGASTRSVVLKEKKKKTVY